MGSHDDPLQPPGRRACTACGTPFTCGMVAGAARCWCADVPPALPVPAAGAGCLCPACLRSAVERAGATQPVERTRLRPPPDQ